ncbi:M4 family metallopeptidase [Amycolatopsis sp. WQ 127309]|uniref:M4 family metallopeptidase n=1 Tax=Amycolatopsis sp. WQ 127309 TaxID=2932773 RepID=UPI001FF44EF0|nr:M4 family metallopeptidase [Amycolatopsis sp. WQ 127309]UOZ09986.1 M4 family metallopeptidase [Amycolatopsis sp. WQ 127309]
MTHRGFRTGLAAAAGLAMTLALPVTPANAAQQAQPAAPEAAAARAADQAAASGLDALKRGPAEAFRRVGLTAGGGGLFYGAYQRTYQGLRVVGGDAVVVADGAGRVRGTSAAETAAITVGTQAGLDAAKAAATARAQLATVDSVSTPEKVVLAGATPKLAYEVVVAGRTASAPSNLHVFVDAATGAVLDKRDDVKTFSSGAKSQAQPGTVNVAGTGNSYYVGNVSIDTTQSGSTYTMRDPGRTGISCGREGGSVYSGPDNAWGNGTGTDLETGCVDVLYSVQTEWKMLSEWLGRNGINGSGTGYPASVGLADVNAYWNGSSTHFGHSQDNQRQATSMDVVGHEFGHGIFQFTPGGAGSGNENGGMNESTGDIFGALTEAYANNPKDVPDYQVGEGVNLVGQGPIRYMYQPSLVGDPNCYSSSIPSTEVHAAAGPQNHWFYLLAEGSAPGGGKPNSPTCNSSSVTGLGIQKAGKIFYNGLLKKTSSWNHKAARKATLEAAIALYPGSCTEYNTTKAAWDAVSVTAATGEPASCTGGGPDFSVALNPASGSVQPGGSATTTVSTAITSGAAQSITLSASGLPAGATASFSPATVQSGGSSTLTIATTSSTPTGSFPITITADGASTDHTASFSLTVGTTGSCAPVTNGTRLNIPDYPGAAVSSTSTVAGCARNASSTTKVEVHITHTYSGDLVLDLVAPDGSSYRLKNSSSSSTPNINTTYTVNASSEAGNGAWKLQIRDVGPADTGYLSSWTLTV